MPRKNRRSTPPSNHKLSRFERWAKTIIVENQKWQAQRVLNNRKKEKKNYEE